MNTDNLKDWDENRVELIVPTRTERLMMDFAFRVAQEARDRVRIGAVIATSDGNILSYGYNGTPSGYSNTMRDMDDKTKECVIHAEQNAILKLASTPGSTTNYQGGIMYSTIAPCVRCSASIVQAKITKVIFQDYYKTKESKEGLELLSKCDVSIKRIKREAR